MIYLLSTKGYDGTDWGWNGPGVLTEVLLQQNCDGKNTKVHFIIAIKNASSSKYHKKSFFTP